MVGTYPTFSDARTDIVVWVTLNLDREANGLCSEWRDARERIADRERRERRERIIRVFRFETDLGMNRYRAVAVKA
jgi:hypothetical protein